jgi:uncharacterized protein (DUF1501 family)
MEHHDHDHAGCEEYNELTRRNLLRGRTAFTAAAVATLPTVALGRGRGRGSSRDTLISVFQHGGMDGLTTVVPYGDGELYNLRPTLAIPPPGQTDGAVDLDGFFGLAPAAAPLLGAWQDGDLAFIHAAGSPDPTRSHFESTRLIQKATPNMPSSSLSSGWLGRHLQTISSLGVGDLRAVAHEYILPQLLAEGPGALAVNDPTNFIFPGDPLTASARRATISAMYDTSPAPMGTATVSSLAAIDLLATVDFDGYIPANGAVYPATMFGMALRNFAVMIKADIDLEVGSVTFHGWDHHNLMGPLTGTLANMLDDFSRSLEAFHLDMKGDSHGYTLVTQSEFGRRAAENGSAGTDHGHGNVMFVMGPSVNGGQAYGTWPGLQGSQLDNGDVAVTTDYRDVMAEILSLRLGNTQLPTVFPSHTPNFLGIVS